VMSLRVERDVWNASVITRLAACLLLSLVELLSAAGCSAAKEGPERVKTNF